METQAIVRHLDAAPARLSRARAAGPGKAGAGEAGAGERGARETGAGEAHLSAACAISVISRRIMGHQRLLRLSGRCPGNLSDAIKCTAKGLADRIQTRIWRRGPIVGTDRVIVRSPV